VVVEWATGGLVAFVLLATIGATATVFGFGWVIVIVAAAVIGVTMSKRIKLPRLAALIGVVALTLPAVAVAISPMRLTLQSGTTVSAPATAAEVSSTVYHSGFGMMLIDLRRTRLPTTGTVTLRIRAGVRRTIVALPTGQCVRVRLRYDVHTFTAQLAALLSGRSSPPFPDVVLFGRLYGGNVDANPHGFAAQSVRQPGQPLLTIDFTSQGGGLYVRDYPNRVSPNVEPNWPGFIVRPERRPNVHGIRPKLAKMMVRDWKIRHKREVANQRYINSRIYGPCAA
jgi:hypothetical protein